MKPSEVTQGLLETLAACQQHDEDGIMVDVPREALDQVILILAQVRAAQLMGMRGLTAENIGAPLPRDGQMKKECHEHT